MLDITDEQVNSIRQQLGKAQITAVGYRLMVKPINATRGMEGVETENMPELAKAGFITKSDDEASRQTKGSDVGLIVNAGPNCYAVGMLKDCEPWAAEGDVVIFPRYAGHSCELPPGSGNYYQFMADDDLVGKYEGIEL